MKNENLKQNNDNLTVYDFKLPHKFSQKNFRELEIIHREFCQKVSSSLTNYLKLPVKLDFISADQISYGDSHFLLKSVSHASYAPSICFKVNSDENCSVLRLDYESVSRMINRALGGAGSYENKPADLNEIEKAVFKKIGERIARSLEDAFQISKDFQIQSVKVENQYHQGISVLLTFEIKIQNNIFGLMSICYPHSVINAVLRSSKNKNVFYIKEFDKSKTYEALIQAPLELKAVLKETEIKLKDFKHLNAGDILPLNISKDEKINIKIDSENKFVAKILGKNKIEIIKRIEK